MNSIKFNNIKKNNYFLPDHVITKAYACKTKYHEKKLKYLFETTMTHEMQIKINYKN